MKYCIISKKDFKTSEIVLKLQNSIIHDYDEQTPDYVIAIGGDGTLIGAVHQYPNAIIFGVHTGHLGFYSNYVLEDLDLLINDINKGDFMVESVDLLKCDIKTMEESFVDYSINEMTIIMPPRTLILDIYIDDVKFERFRGTGVCVSTAYGSTAYNKSLNGAVLDPSLKSFQLTEIAGINSNAYRTLSSPLVLSKNRRVLLKANENEDVYVTIDNKSYDLKKFVQAEISLVEKQIKLAKHSNVHFAERIIRTFLEK